MGRQPQLRLPPAHCPHAWARLPLPCSGRLCHAEADRHKTGTSPRETAPGAQRTMGPVDVGQSTGRRWAAGGGQRAPRQAWPAKRSVLGMGMWFPEHLAQGHVGFPQPVPLPQEGGLPLRSQGSPRRSARCPPCSAAASPPLRPAGPPSHPTLLLRLSPLQAWLFLLWSLTPRGCSS